MSHKYRYLALLGLLSSSVNAYEVFADALYWHATEAIDWTYANDEHLPNQTITYKTISFHFEPNFRIGIINENYNTSFYYTRFYTHAQDAVLGNSISGFIGDRIANFPNGYFFQAGQLDIIIDYNMFDVDLGKAFCLADKLLLTPVVGLRGGWINQRMQANYQGPVSAVENVKNDFYGAGPKIGLKSQFSLYSLHNVDFALFADFTSSYLWGHWKIKDVYVDTSPSTVHIITPTRYLGALNTQAILGLQFDYRELSAKLGYEILDWFDQCQYFDNGTGAHGNNLILQGITLRFSYAL